ncbi:M16 family metallopeptidase [Taibaiella soli]|uniref:Insulinase family protein n=1 Tax=Taibaiella soli TaxID=1649169 RepID=A0A2W2AGE0_9BACT|nr:pitrilysin family protein [Taibaiella soli]PZF71320.1 insulinase family protein [Taibaiella soli]
MKRIFLAFSAAAILYGPATALAQAKLVEKVTQKGKEVTIPYEEYKLPNGLTLLIHEDHSDPIVHVDVTYHVGSAREEIGKSGFAHFFEHMMFQGSDHVADEQHFKIITEAGGTLNGSTNRDRTNYFETVPSNQLEKMLWLEADRMGFLLDAVTQQKFEVQRATVKNERGQNYDNRPYGLVSEVAAKNLYPYGHPYSWLTIGYVEDLNRVNVDDLKNFFLRWYGPNNAVLTVGGDVNPKDVVKLAEKYFGPIPKGPDVQPVKMALPVLNSDRYISMTDNYAKLPMLRVVYPTPPRFDKDEAALDCLAEILGQGNNSIFYKNFVKGQKAVNANSYNSATELSGEFTMSVVPYPGQKLSDMEQMIKASLDEFEKRGVTDDDINKFRSQQEAEGVYGLESVSGKVSQLAAFYTFTGNPNYIGNELKRYTSVTKEDVMRVYNKYIKGKHAVYVSVMTKQDANNKAAADNYTVDTTGYKAPDYGYAHLKYTKPTDKFDRNVVPPAGANPVVNVPSLWKKQLPGNVNVIGTQTNEIPVVNISMEFKGGRMLEAGDLSKAGLANMFAEMMSEDTKKYSAEAFATELEKLGSSIDVSADRDNISVNVRSLKKNLDKTMALLEERLLNSKFTEEAFATNKKRLSESAKNSLNQPVNVANNIFNLVNYGSSSVLGQPSHGSEQTIGNITLADVQNYYDKDFSRKNATIVVVGDVSESEITGKLGFLNQMKDADIAIPVLPAAPAVAQTKIYFVNVPNAAQTEFRVGYVTNMKYDALGDYYKSTIMNYPLGGAFNSRLNLDLREDKGWTYGARSYFDGDKYTGSFAFSAGIRASATDSALADVLHIMKEYKAKGITGEELAFTQKSIGQSDARKYETGFQKAAFLARVQEYNLPTDYSKQQNTLLGNISANDVNTLALKNLPDLDKMNIVLVGDKAKVWDGLQKLGYQIVELDREGKPVQN